MKKVLIIGKNSYIGDSIEKWLKTEDNLPNYNVSIVSSRDESWQDEIKQGYDIVINVAGIAHIKIKDSMENSFYQINRDLAVKICEFAKENRVQQYIYLSSMNVYGDTNLKIDEKMNPMPRNFYGKSKLEADQKIQMLASDRFCVVSIRPPVVYGKKCKGNFPLLMKGAKLLPIFPNYKNVRSLLYIDNLCEFVRLCIDNEVTGIYHPQNKEQVSTTEIVKVIAEHYKHKIIYTKIFNGVIRLLMPRVRFLQRIFDNDFYATEYSDVFEYKYCVEAFYDSIRKSLD